MKYLLPSLLLILVWGCTYQESERLPEDIKELENLTVYQADAKPEVKISFTTEIIFDGTSEILVGEKGEVAVDDLGRVFIEDSGKKVIYLFTPDGHIIAELGGVGRGPGEFSSIKSIQIQKNNLYAFDFSQMRLNVFNLQTLTVEETITLARNRGNFEDLRGYYPSIDELYVIDSQSYIAKFISNKSSNRSHWQNVEMTGAFYRLDHTGNLSGKLMEFTDEIRTIFPVRNTAFDIPLTPFFGKSLTALSREGIIYQAGSEHFLIKAYGSDGAYQRAFYYPLENIIITRESAIQYGAPNLILSNPDLFISNYQSIDLPQYWPVLTDLKIDDQDRLWIATTVEDMSIYEWWVLEETGELITTFEWPRDEPIEVIKNGKMYTRETDEDTGLQQVVRYKIEMVDQ